MKHRLDLRYPTLVIALIGGAYAMYARGATYWKGPPPFEFVCTDKRGIPVRDWTRVIDAVGTPGVAWQLTFEDGTRLKINSSRNERCRAFLNESRYGKRKRK